MAELSCRASLEARTEELAAVTEAKAALEQEALFLKGQAEELKSGFELLTMEVNERNTDLLRVQAEKDAMQVHLDTIAQRLQPQRLQRLRVVQTTENICAAVAPSC